MRLALDYVWWGICLAMIGCLPVWGQSPTAGLGPVIVLEQTDLPRLLVDRVTWLPDNRHLAVGGWLEWPQAPVVALLPNDIPALQAASQPASPRFALSPEGRRLAFWKRVRVGQQDKAELNVINLDAGMVNVLGQAVDLCDALHLVWLPGDVLVYAVEDAVKATAVLWAFPLAAGKAQKVLELREASWRQLMPGATPAEVWAQVTGGPMYAVNVQTGDYQARSRATLAIPSPDGSRRSLEIDAELNLIVSLSETEGVIVDRGVRAANWRPDGRAILYVKDHEVCLSGPDGSGSRVLVSLADKADRAFLRGCLWSPDGTQIAYWAVGGGSGRSWRATLGLEQITGRFRFGRSAPAKAGDRVWVVGTYQRDNEGAIIEPVWSTLKACFEITRILRTPEGVVVEAKNIGAQGGVLDRIAGETISTGDDTGHIRIGVEGGPAATWNRASTMKFRPGLSGWLEKTPYAGETLSLNVERQTLLPISPNPASR